MSAESSHSWSEPHTLVSDDMLAHYAADILDNPKVGVETVESVLEADRDNEEIFDALFRLAWDADERLMCELDTRLNGGQAHPSMTQFDSDPSEQPITVEVTPGQTPHFLLFAAKRAVRSLQEYIIRAGNSPYLPRGPRTMWGRRLD